MLRKLEGFSKYVPDSEGERNAEMIGDLLLCGVGVALAEWGSW